MVEMIWRGDKITKHDARIRNNKAYVPIAIVDHISVGTMGSMYNTFANPNAPGSSHYGVGRDGIIHQYVRLSRAAYTQGLTAEAIKASKQPLVQQMGVNPNLYCVGIEHEGYAGHGVDGDLTEPQFWSSAWLHKYIQEECQNEFGYRIQLNPYYVLGHFQIDPVRKPFCPGLKFPWTRLYNTLAKADGMTLEMFEEYIDYQRGGNGDYAKAYAATERSRDLGGKLVDPKWGKAAEEKLLWLADVLPQIGYMGEVTAAGIVAKILSLYDTLVKGGKYAKEALRKLLIVYTFMKAKSLL
jgi:N-acetyl-anhydromuramyl-L-alanine amidase AmpD